MISYKFSMKLKDIVRKVKVGRLYFTGKKESEPWEPFVMFRRSDPVSFATYAQNHELLDVPGWKRLKAYVRNQNKMNRMVKQIKLNSRRIAPL